MGITSFLYIIELPRLSSQPIIINITLKSVAVKFMFDQIKGKEIAHKYQIEYSDVSINYINNTKYLSNNNI